MMQADDTEYQKVFDTLDELDLGSLKPVFKEKRFRVTSHITNTKVVEPINQVMFYFSDKFLIFDEQLGEYLLMQTKLVEMIR